MIKTPTVLILGAGASMDYRFPSSQELVNEICKNLQADGVKGWGPVLEEFGIKTDEVKKFSSALTKALAVISSVDEFLEHTSFQEGNSKFLEIGKFAIALALMRYELKNQLLNSDGLYKFLFGKLISSKTDFNDFDKNHLSIITFNYDRSIEQYLFLAMNYLGYKEEEYVEKLKRIPIIHVHGRLGALPWQEEGGRPYQSVPLYREKIEKGKKKVICHEDLRIALPIASEGIKIISSENMDTSPDFKEAFELMMKAKRIYFLGFGYNDFNLQKLKIDEIARDKILIKGTAFRLGDIKTNKVTSKWGIKLSNKDHKILDFLENDAPLD